MYPIINLFVHENGILESQTHDVSIQRESDRSPIESSRVKSAGCFPRRLFIRLDNEPIIKTLCNWRLTRVINSANSPPSARVGAPYGELADRNRRIPWSRYRRYVSPCIREAFRGSRGPSCSGFIAYEAPPTSGYIAIRTRDVYGFRARAAKVRRSRKLNPLGIRRT